MKPDKADMVVIGANQKICLPTESEEKRWTGIDHII